MTKTRINKLLIVTMILTLISVSLLGGTLAAYTTDVTVTSTVTVAKFEPALTVNGDGTEDAVEITDSINLFDNVTNQAQAGLGEDTAEISLIAPGATGSFDLVFDNSAGEVATKFTLSAITESVDNDAALDIRYSVDGTNFYSLDGDNAFLTTVSSSSLTQSIDAGDTDTSSITIYWIWYDYEESADNTGGTNDDAAQTTLAMGGSEATNGMDYIVTITVTAEQTSDSSYNPA